MQLETKTTLWAVVVSALALALALWDSGVLSANLSGAIGEAFQERTSGLMVESEGRVKATLRDERRGSRRQRFTLELESGLTVLVTHNVDVAQRVENLARGDRVRFRGLYAWNQRGGVIHGTHADPEGQRRGGWIEHDGRRYF